MFTPATKLNPSTGKRQWAAPCLLAAVLAAPACLAFGQASAVPAPPTAATIAMGTTSAPAWNTLSPSQQAALQPLAPIWNTIDSNRKRKWIALSANFSRLSAPEQATLQARMGDWAALSPIARNRARLNFAESRSLTILEKKAQWEAYQALSPAQKQQLAAQAAASRGSGAAPAVIHRAPGKLAAVPVTRSEAGTPSGAMHRYQPALPAAPTPGAAPTNP